MGQTAREKQQAMPHSGRATRTAKKTPSGFSAFVLFTAGFAMSAIGATLVVQPSFIPHSDWIAQKLGELGVTGFPLCVGGVSVFCLGFVSRLIAQSTRALAQPEESNVENLIGQTVDDLSKVRNAMGNVQIELLANKSRQDSIIQSLMDLGRNKDDGEGDSAQANAMFRLAASLDQLGGRIDERLRGQSGELKTSMHEMATSFMGSQQQLFDALADVSQAVEDFRTELEQSSNATNDESFAPSEELPPIEGHDAPQDECGQETSSFEGQDNFDEPEDQGHYEDDLGYEEQAESSDEDMQIFVELEEEPQQEEAPSTAYAQAEPTPEADSSTLGILDQMDDHGVMQDPSSEVQNQPPGPLPSSNEGSGLRMSPQDAWPPRPSEQLGDLHLGS